MWGGGRRCRGRGGACARARACACICLDVGGRCGIFNVGVVDCVYGGVDVVLAVNVEAVECRNIGHVCARNRFQKRCFTTFCCFICIRLSC